MDSVADHDGVFFGSMKSPPGVHFALNAPVKDCRVPLSCSRERSAKMCFCISLVNLYLLRELALPPKGCPWSRFFAGVAQLDDGRVPSKQRLVHNKAVQTSLKL